MADKFNAKKQSILGKLSVPEEKYIDASPKGSVDEDVRDLVLEINAQSGFVTTSSCSGRMTLYLEGPSRQANTRTGLNDTKHEPSVAADNDVSASVGGKGGGKWLFTSHSPVDLEQFLEAGSLLRYLGLPLNAQTSFPSGEARPRLVHFKFEPMILHILSSDAEHARAALAAATAAGFRESGISGLIDGKSRPTPPMVAVRSSGLALDSIIGYQYRDTAVTGFNEPSLMVSEEYLRTLVRIVNERFEMNEERKQRFAKAFLEHTTHIMDASSLKGDRRVHKRGYESAAMRKERKRQEGLSKRERNLAFGGMLDGAEEEPHVSIPDEDEKEYDLDFLMQDKEDEVAS